MKILPLLMLIFSTPLYAGEIYVSPKGYDSSPGTVHAPVKTPQRALRIAREWRRTQDPRIKGGIRIILEGGAVFQLDEPLFLRPEDSGTEESKTVITTIGAVRAVLSGGIALQSADDDILSKARRLMSGETYGVTVAGRPLLTRSLWIGEKKYPLANSFGEGVMQRILAFDKEHETITIPAAALRNFGIMKISDAPQLEMVVHQRWAIAILRVKDFYFDGDKAVLSFHNPESRWEFQHPWPQPVIEGERGSSSFLLRNAKQFVDTDGEWWQDYRTGKIICHNVTARNAVVPRLNRLLTIRGQEGERVHDIVFDNVAFQHTAWERPAEKGHVTLQGGFPIVEAYKLTEHEGLPWAKGLENQAWIERPEAAVSIENAERVDFVGCSFTHLAATALDYVAGCSDIEVSGNTFSDIGGTAILVGSFLEGPSEVHRPYSWTIDGGKGALSPGRYTERITISQNRISDATNEDWGAVGIACGFVRDVVIEKNIVSRVNYCGICVGWGWTPEDTGMRNNKIIGNTVTDYARQLYDAGGIYTMSCQPNSVITGNTVAVPAMAPYATNYRAFPIYFDACTDGYHVYGNSLSTSAALKERYGYNTPGPDMKVE